MGRAPVSVTGDFEHGNSLLCGNNPGIAGM